MMRTEFLHATQDVEIERYDHSPGVAHHDPKEEFVPGYFVSFVEQGSFEFSLGRQSWRLGPGDVLLGYPGLPYRFRHAEAHPDDVCFSVAFPAAGETPPWGSRNVPMLRPNNRLRYLHHTLAQRAESASGFDVDCRAAELLAAVAACVGTGPRDFFRHSQLCWYAERIEAAREQLERRFDQQHSLRQLAGSVGMSTFHFARVFSELVGTAPHQYLLRTRLRNAAQMLQQGASVTDTCFACGFQNLSHFVRLFRRRFGTSPSRYEPKRGSTFAVRS
jgi:AraC family transcriptional regulator